MSNKEYHYSCTERFLQYVQLDTQSDFNSPTCPSTAKQKILGKLLVEELHSLGVNDAEMDEFGYVYAAIHANTTKDIPVLCFCSHMDVSPDAPAANIKPMIHKNYQGGDLILVGDTTYNITEQDNPDLSQQIGNDIITSDGTTLLGGDDKAGLAIIMNAVEILKDHPDIQHGKIRILFTPDEEIARGPDKADLQKLGAQFGYTFDGEELGSIEDETFNADSMIVEFHCLNLPAVNGFLPQSAIFAAAQFIDALPKDRLTPSTTKGREGFIHPVACDGDSSKISVKFIIRAFDMVDLKDQEQFIQTLAEKIVEKIGNNVVQIHVTEQYRNMKEVLDKYPFVVDYAVEAINNLKIQAIRKPIRGGTDGSRFSFMGMPCPNVFDGTHNFHSRQEWCSIQDMEKGVDVALEILKVWEKNWIC